MRRWPVLALSAYFLCGCGTTRYTDSPRTATEQLLLSTAVDQALENVRLDALRGFTVYLDEQYAESKTDLKYVLFRVREKLLQDGALLSESPEEAEVIVQVGVGALGTDRYTVLVGLPEVAGLGVVTTEFPLPPALPEVPLLKATNQHGVAKIRIIAYRRVTGELVALSGNDGVSTTHNRSTWLVGIGPFEQGSVRHQTSIAGKPIPLPNLPGVIPGDDDATRSAEMPAPTSAQTPLRAAQRKGR